MSMVVDIPSNFSRIYQSETTVKVEYKQVIEKTCQAIYCSAIGGTLGSIGFLFSGVVAGSISMGALSALSFVSTKLLTEKEPPVLSELTLANSQPFRQWYTQAKVAETFPSLIEFLKDKLPLSLCPLSHEIIEVPVLAPDGMTYEKKSIEAYLDNKTRDPSEKVSSPLMENFYFCKNDLILNAAYFFMLKRITKKVCKEKEASEGVEAISSLAEFMTQQIIEKLEITAPDCLNFLVERELIGKGTKDLATEIFVEIFW